MTVLGAGRGPSLLRSVTLSLDEMQYLQETLGIDELPVVLDAMGRYDKATDHDAAMAAAAATLAERDLLDDDQVHPELAERLRVLYRPHWVLAVRWYVSGQVNRFCLAKGEDFEVVALRGPGSYVIDEASHDLAGTVLAALGPAEPLELAGMNAPTADLVPIFDDAGDAATTAKRLTEVGKAGPRRAGHRFGSGAGGFARGDRRRALRRRLARRGRHPRRGVQHPARAIPGHHHPLR